MPIPTITIAIKDEIKVITNEEFGIESYDMGGNVESVAISSDGKYIAAGNENGNGNSNRKIF